MNTTYNKTYIVFLLCLFVQLLPKIAEAQPSKEWDKTYGGAGYDALTTAVKTDDGGFLLVGSSSSAADGRDITDPPRGNADFWIVKIDSFGNKQFDKRYGGSEVEVCYKVIQNTEGYLLVGGTLSDSSGDKTQRARGNMDMWIVQIRPDGTKLWDKTFGGTGTDLATNAVVTDNGENYIIVGHSDSPISGDKTENSKGKLDVWLVKIDKNGNKIWDKTVGGSENDDFPLAVTKTQDGNFIVGCGSVSGQSGDKTDVQKGIKDVWIIKFDTDGHKLWDKSYGGTSEDVIFDMQELSDASVLLGCNSRSEVGSDKTSENFGLFDIWLVKIDQNGNKLWDKTFGGSNNDFAVALDQNKTGYILVAGQSISLPSGNKTDTLHGNYDFWLVYIDEQGNKIWDKNFGGSGNDAAFELVKFRDGSYLVCGGSASDMGFDKSDNARGKTPEGYNNDDFWIVKIRCLFDLNLGNDTLVCRSAPVFIDAAIPNCRNCLYQWSNGATTSSITVHPEQTTSYNVRVTATDACIIRDDIKIVIIPSPTLATYTVQSPSCHDGHDGVIALDSARGGTPPYFLLVNQDTFPRQVFIDKRTAGTYVVALVDRKGCRLEKEITIPNPPLFELSLPPSIQIALGDSVRLKVTSNRPLSNFYWSDRTIRSLDTFVKPFDSYTYSISATDVLGCIKNAVMQVTVKRDNLYFAPQIFSPNNDGVNDFYTIFGGITVISIDNMKIFNRWGELVFLSPHIYPAAETAGWNGHCKNAESPIGTYVFIAEVTYLGGKKEIIQGNFTLIR